MLGFWPTWRFVISLLACLPACRSAYCSFNTRFLDFLPVFQFISVTSYFSTSLFTSPHPCLLPSLSACLPTKISTCFFLPTHLLAFLLICLFSCSSAFPPASQLVYLPVCFPARPPAEMTCLLTRMINGAATAQCGANEKLMLIIMRSWWWTLHPSLAFTCAQV